MEPHLKLFVLAALAALLPTGLRADGEWNGFEFTDWNGSAITAWNGSGVSAGGGGGGGIALVSQMTYSPNNGSITTGTMDTTGADFIVVLVGAYTSWAPTGMSDSESNTWTAGTQYGSGANAVRFFTCVAPTTGASHTFTPTGGSVNLKLYSFYGILAFENVAASPLDQANGQSDSTIPFQPGSITPTVDDSLIVAGCFTYNSGSLPTNDASMTIYGTAYSGNIGCGAIGWKVQTTATAINPTWTGPGTDGGYNIANYKP